MAATLTPTTGGGTYLKLVHAFPLRPIRTRATHRLAKVVLRSLFGRHGSATRDYKSVLASLIAEYERSAHLRIDTSRFTAAEIVLHLLEDRSMSVNAFAKQLDISQSSLNDMINGRRDWSKVAIVRICEFFGLQPALFLRAG